MAEKQYDSVLEESRTFEPSEEFKKGAHISSMEEYKKMYDQSIKDPEGFWGTVAEDLHWYKKWDKVLNEDDAPFFKWYEGGKTNMSYNCLDRHLDSPTKNKAAIIFEGEPGDERVLTYRDLWREVNKFANVLKKLGIKKGDRVAVYLPMIPELPITLLACARIGAIHSVIFAGFSAESIKDRVLDSQANLVITSDGGYRRATRPLCKTRWRK